MLISTDYYEKISDKIEREVKAIDECLARHRELMKELNETLKLSKYVLDDYRRPD